MDYRRAIVLSRILTYQVPLFMIVLLWRLGYCCRRKCKNGLVLYASLFHWWRSVCTNFDLVCNSTVFSNLARSFRLGESGIDGWERPLAPSVQSTIPLNTVSWNYRT